MKLCSKSLRSFAIALGLAISTTGCFAQVDAGAGEIDALLDSETLSADDSDEGSLDFNSASPDEQPTANADGDPPPPPPPPDGACTGTSCTHI
jgi:hypothetical protein